MATPGLGSPEAGERRYSANLNPEGEGEGFFLIEFPDGTTQRVESRKDAVRAIEEWRSQVH